MATGKPAQIMEALFTHAALMATTGPTLPVSLPEPTEVFDPPADGKFLEVQIFPNKPAWQGVADGKLDQGLLSIGVIWPRGQGLIAPGEVAGQVIAHFAKVTQLTDGATRVKIGSEPWAGKELIEPSRVVIPVVIPWTA